MAFGPQYRSLSPFRLSFPVLLRDGFVLSPFPLVPIRNPTLPLVTQPAAIHTPPISAQGPGCCKLPVVVAGYKALSPPPLSPFPLPPDRVLCVAVSPSSAATAPCGNRFSIPSSRVLSCLNQPRPRRYLPLRNPSRAQLPRDLHTHTHTHSFSLALSHFLLRCTRTLLGLKQGVIHPPSCPDEPATRQKIPRLPSGLPFCLNLSSFCPPRSLGTRFVLLQMFKTGHSKSRS